MRLKFSYFHKRYALDRGSKNFFTAIAHGGVPRQVEGGYPTLVLLQELSGLSVVVDGGVVHDEDCLFQPGLLTYPSRLRGCCLNSLPLLLSQIL